VRRSYFGEDSAASAKVFTAPYMRAATGNDKASARQNWGVGLKLMGNAVVQLSAQGVG